MDSEDLYMPLNVMAHFNKYTEVYWKMNENNWKWH